MNSSIHDHPSFRNLIFAIVANAACMCAWAQAPEPPEVVSQTAEPEKVEPQEDQATEAEAQEPEPQKAEPAAAEVTEISVAQLLEMIQRQDREIESQRELIAKQQTTLDAQTEAIKALQTRIDQVAAIAESPGLSDEDLAIRARLESLEGVVAKMPEVETTTTYDATEFPGAFPIPGSTAAIRIGGFVKMNTVESFSALGTKDRFIVGTIPTRGSTGDDAETALTVDQSRLNFELRERTGFGDMRAFIEGDFAGGEDSETFRLRHAFGQVRDLMAGQTWTTFMDVESSPEELDFEGINGRINVRQPQFRFFPKIGEAWNLAVSIEDPNPDVAGGDGVSQIPDMVASIRRTWFERWHIKSSVLIRNVRARQETDESNEKNEVGWALSISGRTAVPWWDERDNVTFQLNVGEGYGRYVNDLGTVGGQDAVFDEATGDMAILPVIAGYVGFQHWWREKVRSTFVASFVDIDNESFQEDEAYNSTQRISGNLIWSPTPRIEVGGELLWGRREDNDGEAGTATQVQGSLRYRF